jgi:hypothetical protein
MKHSPGLVFIIGLYAFIGGLAFGITLFGVICIFNLGFGTFFLNSFVNVISENTIITTNMMNNYPRIIVVLIATIWAFLFSIFHTILAEALFLGKAIAFKIAIIFHTYSALSAIVLWGIGLNTIKNLGIFFLFLNMFKAFYLYKNQIKMQ